MEREELAEFGSPLLLGLEWKARRARLDPGGHLASLERSRLDPHPVQHEDPGMGGIEDRFLRQGSRKAVEQSESRIARR